MLNVLNVFLKNLKNKREKVHKYSIVCNLRGRNGEHFESLYCYKINLLNIVNIF